MPKNPFFKHNTNEQSLINDLTVETIKIHGEDMVFIPRVYVREDQLFGEDVLSRFSQGNTIEMYIENVDAFQGEGDFIAKFGLDIRDSISLIVSKSRFGEVMRHDPDITRPREGDLVYFPLAKSLLEIKFVEHENPFYQSGSLYTYKLSCELFRYSHETIETGFSDIDMAETDRNTQALDLTLGTQYSSEIDYVSGEEVFQLADGGTSGVITDAEITGIVTHWDRTTKSLFITQTTGTFGLAPIIGSDSSASYEIDSIEESIDTIPLNPVSKKPLGDNDVIQKEQELGKIIDFSDTNPFSEGSF